MKERPVVFDQRVQYQTVRGQRPDDLSYRVIPLVGSRGTESVAVSVSRSAVVAERILGLFDVAGYNPLSVIVQARREGVNVEKVRCHFGSEQVRDDIAPRGHVGQPAK